VDYIPLLMKLRGKHLQSDSESIPVTGRGSLQGCETSRIPRSLDNRIMDGCEVVSITCRPRFTFLEESWYSFLLKAESTSGP
jgi:hypothetical protein